MHAKITLTYLNVTASISTNVSSSNPQLCKNFKQSSFRGSVTFRQEIENGFEQLLKFCSTFLSADSSFLYRASVLLGPRAFATNLADLKIELGKFDCKKIDKIHLDMAADSSRIPSSLPSVLTRVEFSRL